MEDEPAAPAEPEKEPKDVEEILKGFKGIPGELTLRARDGANLTLTPILTLTLTLTGTLTLPKAWKGSRCSAATT